MLCVALTPATLDEIFHSERAGADLVEVRLDYLNDPRQSLDVSWSKFDVPVIATCRRRERGGLFGGTVDEERQLLETAVRNGATYVDIDYRDARPIDGARLIASYHNLEETPVDVPAELPASE